MKRFRILAAITMMALLFSLAGVVSADEIGPTSISSFTISPSSALVGESVTFTFEFDVPNTDSANTICIYYDDGNYETTMTDLNSQVTSDLGDSYTLEVPDSTGTNQPTTSCPAVSGYYVVGYTVSNPHSFSSGGDSISTSFTVPSGAGTETFTSQQYNPGTDTLVDTLNATLTIDPTPSTVYVSNDSTCGGNSPCYSGGDALQSAFDAVASGGTVNIYGAWSQGGGNSAQLTGSKNVTLTGFNSPRIENGGGTCSGAMIDNQGSGTLTVQGLTIDGTCGSGSRSAGILNSGTGQTNVMDNANTIRDFTGSGNAGVKVSNGTMIVAGNTFVNNYAAMEASDSGTLYAFANNVTSNTGSDAASFAGSGSFNVKCNYWGGATISGFGSDYDERLGSPVNSYVEGTGALGLGQASLTDPDTNNRVLINMGRDTDNPPFNNGTTSGLGALVSDFYAACTSRDSSNVGQITVTGDNVTPGSNGFRLYEIQDVADCSPADNTACWDYAGGSPGDGATCSSTGCSVTDQTASEGHFIVGNEVDPTAITFTAISASSNPWLSVGLVVTVSVLALGALVVLRKRA